MVICFLTSNFGVFFSSLFVTLICVFFYKDLGVIGAGKPQNDAASVRTAHPIPPACGIYYFEVKIISKSKNGYMGIGLTAQQFRMNRLPGDFAIICCCCHKYYKISQSIEVIGKAGKDGAAGR